MEYKNLTFSQQTKFLVTGAAGFIGSHLAETLLNMGYRVRGLDNFSTGQTENVERFTNYSNYEFVEGDITSFQTCLEVCDEIDYVLHQAALGSAPRSIVVPLLYEDTNIKGTLNMLEAARLNGVKRFVYASSSSVYGDEPNLPKKEGKEGTPLSPYALTKIVNEKYAKMYTELYSLPTYGLRYFNVFGKRQDPNGPYAAVIPKFIKCLINNESPIINGNGKQSRDFTYIENVIEANLKACKATEEVAGEVYNIATGSRQFLIDVYYKLCKLLGKNIKPIFGPERKGDIKHSHADISKAQKLLDYTPKWSFNKGIVETVEWYKKNL